MAHYRLREELGKNDLRSYHVTAERDAEAPHWRIDSAPPLEPQLLLLLLRPLQDSQRRVRGSHSWILAWSLLPPQTKTHFGFATSGPRG